MVAPIFSVAKTSKEFVRVNDQSPRLWWATFILIAVALIFGLVVIYLTDRWRRRSGQTRMSTGDQMAHFRELYEKGEISADEYNRIRQHLTVRMTKEWEAAHPRPTNDAPQPQSPEDTGK